MCRAGALSQIDSGPKRPVGQAQCHGTMADPPVCMAQTKAPMANENTMKPQSGFIVRAISPRFHGSMAPIGRIMAKAIAKGVKAASKKRRTDRQNPVKHHFRHQRPHGPDEDDKGRHSQKNVIHHKRGFAAGR